jgi:hypothetical protein
MNDFMSSTQSHKGYHHDIAASGAAGDNLLKCRDSSSAASISIHRQTGNERKTSFFLENKHARLTNKT